MNTLILNYKDNHKKTNTIAIPMAFAQGGLHDVQSVICLNYQHQAKNRYRDFIIMGQEIYLYIFYLK